MKTHKLIVKGKIFDCYTENQAKKMFEKLMTENIKIKIFDCNTNTFITAYLTDISLEKLDDFEKIIENTELTRHKKNEVYYFLKNREEQRQRINEKIIQEIIDRVIELDN